MKRTFTRTSSRLATYAALSLLMWSAAPGCAGDELTQDAPFVPYTPDQGQADLSDARPDLSQDQGQDMADLGGSADMAKDQAQDQDQGQDMAVEPDQAPDLEALTQLGTPDRPVIAQLPPGYDHKRPMPLLLLLHGYGTTAGYTEVLLGLRDALATHEFILVSPEGTRDALLNQFWNATPTCCDYYGSGVDDERYLLDLIEQAKRQLKVDPAQVWVVGHSNGAFMANHLACLEDTPLTASVTMAGTDYADAERCVAGQDVRTIHIHGTHDEVIYYLGSLNYPGAQSFVDRWLTRHGCDEDQRERTDYDLMGTTFPETTETSWRQCERGDVTFWRMDGVTHIPLLSQRFTEQLLGLLGAALGAP